MLLESLGVMGYGEATGAKHVNVLQHLRSAAPFAAMGYLKNQLSSEDNAYLL